MVKKNFSKRNIYIKSTKQSLVKNILMTYIATMVQDVSTCIRISKIRRYTLNILKEFTKRKISNGLFLRMQIKLFNKYYKIITKILKL